MLSGLINLKRSATCRIELIGRSKRSYTSAGKAPNKKTPLATTERHRYVAFYKYAPIDHVESAAEDLRHRLEAMGGLGRIYIGKEGLNAQMSVPVVCYEAFRWSLSKFCDKWGIGEVMMSEGGMAKAGEEEKALFSKLILKIRNRIVQDALPRNLDQSLDMTKAATLSIDAKQWHAKMASMEAQRDETNVSPSNPSSANSSAPLLFDCRNWYESEVGRFDGAIRLPVDRFSESFEVLDDLLAESPPEQEVLLYCTGGIRCEKVGAYLTQVKGRSNVKTLEGGINRYHKFVKGVSIKNPEHADYDVDKTVETGNGASTEAETEQSLSASENSELLRDIADHQALIPTKSYFKGINYQFDKRNMFYGDLAEGNSKSLNSTSNAATALAAAQSAHHSTNTHPTSSNTHNVGESCSDGDRVTKDVLSRCSVCSRPSDAIHNCANTLCNLLVVLCPSCHSRLNGACSQECKELTNKSAAELRSFSDENQLLLARHLASRYLHNGGAKASSANTSPISQLLPQNSDDLALPFVRSKAFLSDVLHESSAMLYRKKILEKVDLKTLDSSSSSTAPSDATSLSQSTLTTGSTSKKSKSKKLKHLTGDEKIARDNLFRLEGSSRITPVDIQEYCERWSSKGLDEGKRSPLGMDFEDVRAQISVGSFLGHFLSFLIRSSSSRRVLEIGTFLGYSSITMASAIADVGARNGQSHSSSVQPRFPTPSDESFVLSCDLDHISLERARINAEKAGKSHLIHFHLASGSSCIDTAAEKNLQFDFIFIDADKQNFAHYYNEIIGKKLLSPTGILCFDNTLWRGSVLSQDELAVKQEDLQATNASMDALLPSSVSQAPRKTDDILSQVRPAKEQILHDFNKMVARDPRTAKTILPMRDGLTLISWAPQSL